MFFVFVCSPPPQKKKKIDSTYFQTLYISYSWLFSFLEFFLIMSFCGILCNFKLEYYTTPSSLSPFFISNLNSIFWFVLLLTQSRVITNPSPFFTFVSWFLCYLCSFFMPYLTFNLSISVWSKLKEIKVSCLIQIILRDLTLLVSITLTSIGNILTSLLWFL